MRERARSGRCSNTFANMYQCSSVVYYITNCILHKFRPGATEHVVTCKRWRCVLTCIRRILFDFDAFRATFRRFCGFAGRVRPRQPPRSPKRLEKRAKPMRYSPDV
ncbi:hypothetical protein OBBRIDRAFT_408719 [Obba rivulosa]|uniref:Uncharacterized protein n=1 Tax=Obba rivulosa TaxID=1052685 RepID=A0A8E2AM82_9APHY|nr:hypothetical protein OBBRIDRAFT_408719 [Obba rivulosa]